MRKWLEINQTNKTKNEPHRKWAKTFIISKLSSDVYLSFSSSIFLYIFFGSFIFLEENLNEEKRHSVSIHHLLPLCLFELSMALRMEWLLTSRDSNLCHFHYHSKRRLFDLGFNNLCGRHTNNECKFNIKSCVFACVYSSLIIWIWLTLCQYFFYTLKWEFAI